MTPLENLPLFGSPTLRAVRTGVSEACFLCGTSPLFFCGRIEEIGLPFPFLSANSPRSPPRPSSSIDYSWLPFHITQVTLFFPWRLGSSPTIFFLSLDNPRNGSLIHLLLSLSFPLLKLLKEAIFFPSRTYHQVSFSTRLPNPLFLSCSSEGAYRRRFSFPRRRRPPFFCNAVRWRMMISFLVRNETRNPLFSSGSSGWSPSRFRFPPPFCQKKMGKIAIPPSLFPNSDIARAPLFWAADFSLISPAPGRQLADTLLAVSTSVNGFFPRFSPSNRFVKVFFFPFSPFSRPCNFSFFFCERDGSGLSSSDPRPRFGCVKFFFSPRRYTSAYESGTWSDNLFAFSFKFISACPNGSGNICPFSFPLSSPIFPFFEMRKLSLPLPLVPTTRGSRPPPLSFPYQSTTISSAFFSRSRKVLYLFFSSSLFLR